MAKFKVGDRVRVLDGSKIGNYLCGWSWGMEDYVGQVKTIKNVDGRGYQLQDGGPYTWDERGLKLVDRKEKKVVIYIDKEDPNIVVAKDVFMGEKAIAKCSPDDTFDFRVGAKIAMERLLSMMDIEEKALVKKPKIGDFVIGNEKANRYGVTRQDTIWKVEIPVSEGFGDIYLKGPGDYTGYFVDPECFDLYTEPLYNGDIVCVRTTSERFIKGKIYSVRDGVIIGSEVHQIGYFKDFESLNGKVYYADFIELVK